MIELGTKHILQKPPASNTENNFFLGFLFLTIAYNYYPRSKSHDFEFFRQLQPLNIVRFGI